MMLLSPILGVVKALCQLLLVVSVWCHFDVVESFKLRSDLVLPLIYD